MESYPRPSAGARFLQGVPFALYFTLALMALRISNPVLRGVVVSVCLAIPFCVGTARLYRGMHHVSDVGVAIVNGALAALLAWCWLRRSSVEDQTRDVQTRDVQTREERARAKE